MQLDISLDDKEFKIKKEDEVLVECNKPTERKEEVINTMIHSYEDPYKMIFESSLIKEYNYSEVSFISTSVDDSGNYDMHCEFDGDKLTIFDFSSKREQMIRKWEKKEWDSNDRVFWLVLQSIKLSYEKPQELVESIINDEHNKIKSDYLS